jgi:hypothetical protein
MHQLPPRWRGSRGSELDRLQSAAPQNKKHGETMAKPTVCYRAVCQNLVPLVNIKIAGKWMFIPLKMVLIGIDS